MNNKSLRILEFNKIKERLKKYVQTEATKDLVEKLQPYDNIYEVKEHLIETKEALYILVKKGSPPFEGLYDVRNSINKIEKGSMVFPGELLKIGKMLSCARKIKEFIAHKEEEQSYRIIEDICDSLTPLKTLENEIITAIVSEEEISDKASRELYNIRRSLRDKNSSVKDKVNSLVRTYSKYLQDNLYTIRGDRYVIPVKAEHKASVPGLVHDQSSTGATLFIEPMSLVTLNNDIKELMLKEKAEIEKILNELCGKVYENIDYVKTNAQILWELDFIFGKAKYASDLNCTYPIINPEGRIDIIEGRHPLIDPKVVVPSNIYLGREFNTLVITGPNTGGKTVSLKTLGLLHIMAMSGLLIPARENSTVGFFKEVFADIGDEQSIEQSLSTFSSHMTNIVDIINKVNQKSLILFDELGAGTDPTEGAALAISILDNLRKTNCKIVATTHYSELKAYALRTIGVENASVEFDVKTLKPTYRLLIGIPGKSNAFEISKRLGLPEYIIEYARENISKDTLKFEDLIQSLQEKTIKVEKDVREAEIIKQEAGNIKNKFEEKMYKLNNSREKVIYDAQREAKLIIKEAKEEADKILKNIRELERMGYSSEVRTKLENERKRLKDKLEGAEENLVNSLKDSGEKLETIKEGEEVFLPSLNKKVIVLTKPDSKGEVQVQAGIMKISVKFQDLRKSKSSKEERKLNKQTNRKPKLNLSNVATSLDLRGMDSQEALYEMDKYLDDAYMGGLAAVTIIHGKGTGVLRSVVNDMLKNHPHVKSYRLGSYGEGGNGVTVVELK